MDFDVMLSIVGDFGRFQCLLMLLFSVINVLSSFHYFAQTFISVLPESTSCEIAGNNTAIADLSPTLHCPLTNNATIHDKIICDYNLTYGYSSIVDELNWVCGNEWKPALGQSLFFVGSVLGTLLLGILADRIGRLHVLVLANAIAFAGNAFTIFASEFITFSIGRFIAGLATDTNFVMMYIIVMEYMKPSMRTFGLNLCIGVFYCVGCVIVPWVAVYMRTWRYFLAVVALPHLSVFLFYFLVPESAQWLISKKRIEDAQSCFQKIAKINRKQNIPTQVEEEFKEYCRSKVQTARSESLMGLFRTPRLRKKTSILIFKSMVITLCYDAISRNVNGLDYSPFTMFSITSATILPACVVILCLQDYLGRKAMACFSLLISGIFTSATGIMLATLRPSEPTTTLMLAIIARLGINVAYNSGAQYAVELVPTEVRGQGVATIHVAGYAASFFSSQILYLGVYNRALPELILGGLSIAGAAACLFLPETLDRTLPVTLEDGEQFGEDENVCEFACCRRRITTSTSDLLEKY